ncbi:phosphoglycerate kinase [Candidatus Bathyarchaeota archaeon]|nr:MAG: phosphoglycerate kinase [Candidatus Bathyarchaeota archaeon]
MPYEFKNIYSNIEKRSGPIAIRFDINSPVGRNGRIAQRNGDVNLRLETNAYLLQAYSKLGPLILMAHQGRKNPPGKKPDKDFVNLLDHHLVLSNLSGIRIHFVEYSPGESWEEYSAKLVKQVKHTEPGEAVLMDNLRIWDFEKEFKPDCPYIPLFQDLGLAAYINDGLPLWHRDDASLMFGRHVAPTYIGHISMKELRTQHRILHDTGRKVMIIGGKKPKFEAIPNLVDKMDILTAGVTGILTAKLSGHEIGPRNEELLADVFKGMDKEIKLYGDLVEDYCIGYPVDFTLSQQGNFSDSNRFNVQLKDLSKPEWETYEIYDIGKETVKSYAEMINTGRYDWRIRAGPNGVYEMGFNNGIKLIEHILGTGFVALGGDTVEELQHFDLCKPIMYSDGIVLLGGGSHVEGFAGMPYPSIEDLLEHGSVS